MKFSLLFAAALLLGALSSTNAQAALVGSQDIGLISGDNAPYALVSQSNFSAMTEQGNYAITGQLANNTKVVFTLTSSSLNSSASNYSGNYVSTIGIANGSTTANGFVNTSGFSASNGSLPIQATASLTGNDVSSSLTFVNMTGAAVSIQAIFNYMISLAAKGSYTISMVSSAVPLPASVVLMLTALLGMVGYTQYRKARGEA